MSVAELRSHLYRSIEQIENEALLKDLSRLIEAHKRPEADFWDELSKETKQAIDEGIADADAVRVRDGWQVLAALKKRKVR